MSKKEFISLLEKWLVLDVDDMLERMRVYVMLNGEPEDTDLLRPSELKLLITPLEVFFKKHQLTRANHILATSYLLPGEKKEKKLEYVYELVQLNEKVLRRTRNFGKKSFVWLEYALHDNGLKLERRFTPYQKNQIKFAL